MASDGITNIHNHGVELDPKKKRVGCNYCAKVVSGFHRLKCHLGGIKGDVVSCTKVPNEVKDIFEKQILEKKMKKLHEIDEKQHLPRLPLKRKLSLQRDEANNNESDIQINRFEDQHCFEGDCSQESSWAKTMVSSELSNGCAEDSSTVEVRQFFYEMVNNFSAIQLPRFLEMISTLSSTGQTADDNLSCQELKECLDYTLIQMHKYVNDQKETWKTTGCSILLDGWMDSKNQNLVNILVSGPKGVIYLKSSNISTLVGNVDAMVAFCEEVLQEVGVKNVVQIITNSTLAIMVGVGEKIMQKHEHLFWTMSASTCIELMLEKFRTIRLIKRVFEKARIIVKFIQNHDAALRTLSTSVYVHNLVKPSKVKSLVPYLTLENIVQKQEILKKLFASNEWRASSLSTSLDGRSVADIVKNSAFWADANVALKASIPLLHLLHKNNNLEIGNIYETIDQAKETIQKELKHKFLYMPFWDAIDEIWNKNLHSPLHSAGYFLNPTLFYSSSFHSDPEVATGFAECVTRMIGDYHVKRLVRLQIAEYIWTRGTMNVPTNLSPAIWWWLHGGQFPELHKFAIRILDQTCDGATKFDLTRDLAELHLASGTNPIEQRALKDFAFVHYNTQLQKF